MSVAVFCALAVLLAAWIAYPLWRGGRRTEAGVGPQPAGERARPRPPQTRGAKAPATNPACPACGQGYEPGDRFCVRCGAALEGAAPPAGREEA